MGQIELQGGRWYGICTFNTVVLLQLENCSVSVDITIVNTTVFYSILGHTIVSITHDRGILQCGIVYDSLLNNSIVSTVVFYSKL